MGTYTLAANIERRFGLIRSVDGRVLPVANIPAHVVLGRTRIERHHAFGFAGPSATFRELLLDTRGVSRFPERLVVQGHLWIENTCPFGRWRVPLPPRRERIENGGRVRLTWPQRLEVGGDLWMRPEDVLDLAAQVQSRALTLEVRGGLAIDAHRSWYDRNGLERTDWALGEENPFEVLCEHLRLVAPCVSGEIAMLRGRFGYSRYEPDPGRLVPRAWPAEGGVPGQRPIHWAA